MDTPDVPCDQNAATRVGAEAYDADLQELAAYAARVLEGPVALVTELRADRQTLLASVGLDRDWTSLAESFCAHAALQDGVFEVRDASVDPRFREDPLVTGEAHVRFYAGVPARRSEEGPSGALCVFDTEPRALTEFQRETLALLARQVQSRLDLRRRERELEAERARAAQAADLLRLVTDRLPVRIAYVDRDMRYRFLSGEYARAYGRPTEDAVGRPVAELAGDAAFDVARPALERALGGEEHAQVLEVEYPFGRVWVEARFTPDVGADGAVRGVILHASDVTERVRAEGEHARERTRLGELLDRAPAFAALLEGPDLVFTYANADYLKLVGHRDVIGRPVREALPEVEGQGFFEGLDAVMATGEPMSGREMAVQLQRAPNGPLELRYIDLLYQAMPDEDGRPHGVFAHGVDVTDHVLARREAVERAELFRTVFEQAPDDAIVAMDEARRITAWNPAAERIMGWTPEEAVGESADLFFTPEDRARGAATGEILGAAVVGRVPDERWHLRKDGSLFWGSGTMSSLHDEGGAVRGYLKVFRDATERHEETSSLAFLRRLTDAVLGLEDPSGIVRTAERMLGEHLGASRVLYGEFPRAEEELEVAFDWTDGVASLVGIHALRAFGSRIEADLKAGRTSVFSDRERDPALADGLEGLRAGETAAAISVPVRKEGRLVGVFAANSSSPREWSRGEVDLVEQVGDRMAAQAGRARAEAALREANQSLESRVAERTAELQRTVRDSEGFNYSISHDLRTPLRAISATAGVLLEELGPELGAEHRELLQRQSHNATRMGRLIDDLLRLSRLARADVRRETIDMTEKARSVAAEIEGPCVVEVQEGMVAEADRTLVRTVLQNLIGNACKFSPSGGRVAVGQDGGTFWVQDEGIGFDAAHASRIFMPFERLVADDAFPGTGIGLANVKRVVERHGGRVWFASAPGEGATFFFTLG